jgi:hypothetical protein
MRSLTAKMTANLTDAGGQRRTILESDGARSNRSGSLWTPVDGSHAVFKTVCGCPQTSSQVHFRPLTSTLAESDSQ